MGDTQSQTDEEELNDWEVYEDFGNEVRLMVKPDSNPVVCCVFDGTEKVTEKTATIQLDEQYWAAESYQKAKEKYAVSVEELGK
jgi:hypothetical protein